MGRIDYDYRDHDEEFAESLVKAARIVASEPELEEGLSVKDWADRMQKAVKQAFVAARQGEHKAEIEMWADAGAIALGRIEQILRFQRQGECEHHYVHPENPTDRCTRCGLMHGDRG